MIIKQIKENIIIILQSIGIVFAICVPSLFDISKIFEKYISNNYVTPDNFFVYFALTKGNCVLAIILGVVIWWNIRGNNGDMQMNRDNSVYHNYPYVWYWYCAKVMGIKKCNLIGVPIYMQVKLVMHRIFDEYPLSDSEYPESKDEKVKVSKMNANNKKIECNLILEDTYLIDKSQIPDEKRKLFTVKISRNNGNDFVRRYNEVFIEKIIEEVKILPEKTVLNIFATTNPKNTLNMTRRLFSQVGRGNILHINIFQQTRDGNRLFKEKGKRIY